MRNFFYGALGMAGCLIGSVMAAGWGESPDMQPVLEGFVRPPMDCRPHTRWWWMGNALRKEDIARQLDEMQAQGMGGVEQISMAPVYTKGNHDYLSPAYFELLQYAAEQARQRGMTLSINFGGPGWIWGGAWVPREDQSKVMLASRMRITGPKTFSGPLPREAAINPDDAPRSTPFIAAEDRLLEVVAARVEKDRLLPDTLTTLSARVQDRSITWEVPPGEWQLMAFWITQRDNANAVDHLNRDAMRRYCDTLGAQYAAAVGDYFGDTIDSFFSDSFEVPIYRNGLYWTDGLFEIFKKEKGYDLSPWLPALWWEVGDLSAKVRYDVNEVLHKQGMAAFFDTFLDWCDRRGVRGRMQPYGFVTDNIEGAGAAHIPEMEITAGEKDAVPWLDTRIGPKQYVASGAHLYGRNIISTEAFTYLHWEPYRASLEELKIATDGYFYTGANKIYNHGFIASPERDIVPTRGFYAAIRISPENLWWPYYHHLAEYTARCCWLLRQGRFTAGVAVYSPLADQWAQSVFTARNWTRDFDWGGLGRLLMTNGYGFDLVNDDVLQHHAAFDGAQLRLGEMAYRVLILPNVSAVPLETLRQIDAFVRQGGAVIALETIPQASVGMADHTQGDAEVRRIAEAMFPAPATAKKGAYTACGEGRTCFLKTVLQRSDPLDDHSAPTDTFLKALRECVEPDMEVDLVMAEKRFNEGLVSLHRRSDTLDIYFVANIAETPFHDAVNFRVVRGAPYYWDPRTGERRPIHAYTRDASSTRIPLSLEAFESRFVVFENTGDLSTASHLTQSDFAEVLSVDATGFTARADHNGPHAWQFAGETMERGGVEVIDDLPAAYEVAGAWELRFPEEEGRPDSYQWTRLKSWTEDPQLRHFSGRARYTITFSLPEVYGDENTHLTLFLGAVGNVAEIRMNGKAVGVHWMDGQAFSLDGTARPGPNTLEVEVINTLINRVSGMTEFPGVAAELQPIFGRGGDDAAAAKADLIGYSPLPRSGLLGPVRIVPSREVRVALN